MPTIGAATIAPTIAEPSALSSHSSDRRPARQGMRRVVDEVRQISVEDVQFLQPVKQDSAADPQHGGGADDR